LHAPNDALRDQLVPINRKYPIALLLDACRRYMAKMPDTHRVTTVEYTLIEGVNDQVEHARELAVLLKDFPCKINLIPFNPFSLSSYRRRELMRSGSSRMSCTMPVYGNGTDYPGRGY